MGKTFLYFSFVMGTIFVIMGILVQVAPPPPLKDSGNTKYVFGCLLVLYGIFRLYRAYIALKNSRDSNL